MGGEQKLKKKNINKNWKILKAVLFTSLFYLKIVNFRDHQFSRISRIGYEFAKINVREIFGHNRIAKINVRENYQKQENFGGNKKYNKTIPYYRKFTLNDICANEIYAKGN